jgi:hypothetical protein
MSQGNNTAIRKAITVTIKYDEALEELTGLSEYSARMSANSIFGWLLECILMEHPEIEDMYPPYALYFKVNGYEPKPYSPLFDGDEIFFGVV